MCDTTNSFFLTRLFFSFCPIFFYFFVHVYSIPRLMCDTHVWNNRCILSPVRFDEWFAGEWRHAIEFAHFMSDTATLCNTLQHSATLCNTLQHPATPCNSISILSTHESGAVSVRLNIVFQTLQHPATPCNTLPCNTHIFPDTCTYIRWSGCCEEKSTARFLSDTATHCNILQHHATHRNTLQHPATHISFQTHVHTFVGRGAPGETIRHFSELRILSKKRVLQCADQERSLAVCRMCCSVLQCVAVCCSVLQCVAVCCSVLQRVNWPFSEEYIFFQTANKTKFPNVRVNCPINSLRVSLGSSVQRNMKNKASIFVFPLPDKFFVRFVGVLFEKVNKFLFSCKCISPAR